MRKILKFALIGLAGFVWLVGFAELLGTRGALLAVILSVLLGEVVFGRRVGETFRSHSMRQWVQLYLLQAGWYLFAIAGWGEILPGRLSVEAVVVLALIIPVVALPVRFALSDRTARESLPSGVDEGTSSV